MIRPVSTKARTASSPTPEYSTDFEAPSFLGRKSSAGPPRAGMSLARKGANLFAVVIGFVTLAYCAGVLWNHGATAADGLIFAGSYIPIAFGITAGYHRLLAHRSFETFRWMRYLLAMLGSAATQGPVIEWVADHRSHHSLSDREGDPHSPHVGRGEGWFGSLKGFWHAHVGWVFRTQGLANAELYARDLVTDRGMRWIDKANGVFVLAGFVLPAVAGYLIHSTRGAVSGLIWGGLFRTALMHHVTFSVNSICHLFGRRPFQTSDHSGNVGVLALVTLGESWHHNHHAFPTSAYHGLRWWQLDLTGLTIRLMQAAGLAWNVTSVSSDQQRRKAS